MGHKLPVQDILTIISTALEKANEPQLRVLRPSCSTLHSNFSFRWWNNLIKWDGNYQDSLTIHILTSQAKAEIAGTVWSACWEPSSIPMVPISITKSKDPNRCCLSLFKTLPVFQLLWEPFFASMILMDLFTESGVLPSSPFSMIELD